VASVLLARRAAVLGVLLGFFVAAHAAVLVPLLEIAFFLFHCHEILRSPCQCVESPAVQRFAANSG
jgi:hypothetical protein